MYRPYGFNTNPQWPREEEQLASSYHGPGLSQHNWMPPVTYGGPWPPEPDVQPPTHIPEENNLPPPPPLPPPPYRPAFDFLSPEFDAKAALANPHLKPPNVKVAALNSVAQCRFILPEEMGESLANKHLAFRSTEDVEEHNSRSGPAKVRNQARQLKDSTLRKIAEAVRGGPLTLLRNSFEKAENVTVVTKHARGIRGRCTGTLRGFDRHMNLILQDVLEKYTVRLRIEKSHHVPRLVDLTPESEDMQGQLLQAYTMVEKTRHAFKLEHRERRLKQIFVRGSNVVMVISQSRLTEQNTP